MANSYHCRPFKAIARPPATLRHASRSSGPVQHPTFFYGVPLPAPYLRGPCRDISSNFYIDVFSRRYWQSVETESAAKAEALVLKAERHKQRQRGGGGGSSSSEGGGLRTEDSFDALLSGSSGGGAGGEDDDGEDEAWVDEVDDSLEEGEDEDIEESEQEEAQGDNGAHREKSKDV